MDIVTKHLRYRLTFEATGFRRAEMDDGYESEKAWDLAASHSSSEREICPEESFPALRCCIRALVVAVDIDARGR